MAIADNMPNDRPGDMARRIADLERAVRELRAARNLDQGTITPAAGMGIRAGDFNGTDFANPGTVGNYFGGDGMVINQAYFRPGSVSNDALTSPVVPGVHKVNNNGFPVTLSWAEVVGGNVTVPDNCTRLLATSSVWVYAINPNTTGGSNGTGGDTLWCYIDIGGSSGEVYGLGLSGSGGYTTATSGFSVLKTDLTPGGTLRIKGMASSGYASLGSDSFNAATISTTLIWLR